MRDVSSKKALILWVLVGLALLSSVSCEKADILEIKMSAVEGVYYLDEGKDTWHCPDGSIPDRFLNAKLEKVGKTWLFEYQLPYRDGGSWTTVRICQPVHWDPLTGSYYFRPLTKEDLPLSLKVENIYNWSYSFQVNRIHIHAGDINLNWEK